MRGVEKKRRKTPSIWWNRFIPIGQENKGERMSVNGDYQRQKSTRGEEAWRGCTRDSMNQLTEKDGLRKRCQNSGTWRQAHAEHSKRSIGKKRVRVGVVGEQARGCFEDKAERKGERNKEEGGVHTSPESGKLDGKKAEQLTKKIPPKRRERSENDSLMRDKMGRKGKTVCWRSQQKLWGKGRPANKGNKMEAKAKI